MRHGSSSEDTLSDAETPRPARFEMTRGRAAIDRNFWTMRRDTLLAALASSPGGLSPSEVDERLSIFGPNRMEASQTRSILRKLTQRLLNPLIAILLVAAAVSGASGDVGSFSIIVAVITLSLTLDVVQEHRAELAAEALRESVAIEADAVRNGVVTSVSVTSLVPGDVIKLRTGDLVPADGIVLEARELQVNEALMTGEPFPAIKTSAPSSATSPAEATNALFAGTSTVGGSGTMLIVETGSRTRFGSIAAELAANTLPTALEQGVRRLGLLILRLTLFLTLFVLVVRLAGHHPAMESFLFAVALAVGLTPELLPMVMTVTLARGAQRMADRKVIVKRLSAIHDLGAMDTLCVDKTGTLTEARITLASTIDCIGGSSARVLELATLNSAFQAGVRSALDDAILDRRAISQDAWARLSEVPFDFERRCLSVLLAHEGENLLITKGAPESVIAKCAAAEIDGLAHPLDQARYEQLARLEESYARNGYRLLAIGIKPMSTSLTRVTVDDERELTLIGFCVFSDPVKQDATAAGKELACLGIDIKVVSGDHAAVVTHVAGAVGLANQRIMTGSEIADLTDAALDTRVDNVGLFARVDPDQKRRIIASLRRNKHVVGFLGDGVNDAPAIHAAHVGISVTGATEVARAAADIILLAPDLSVLAVGIREGRRTFANILKYVRMGTSSNFGNMLSMALSSLVLPFLPLLPLQILLNNMLYDLSEVGIPFDEVDSEDIAKPESWDMRNILRFTIIMGAVSSLFDAITFTLLLKVVDADATQFQTGWFVESIATQILVIFLIRSRRLPWRANRPNSILMITSIGALAAAIFLAMGPWGGIFGFSKLSGSLFLLLAAITATYLVAAEVAKRLALKT